jgi:hypothetical protein
MHVMSSLQAFRAPLLPVTGGVNMICVPANTMEQTHKFGAT